MNLLPSKTWMMEGSTAVLEHLNKQPGATDTLSILILQAFAAAAAGEPGNTASQAAGMLKAAVAATDQLTLAPQLHSLLVSCYKCLFKQSSSSSSSCYQSSHSIKCLFKQWSSSTQHAAKQPWKSIDIVSGVLTGIVDAMGYLALPDSAMQSAAATGSTSSSISSSKAGGGKKTSSEGKGSKGGKSSAASSSGGSSSSSSSILAQRLGPGLPPWLHLAGRGLLLLRVLLLHVQSRQDMTSAGLLSSSFDMPGIVHSWVAVVE
jgi:hypothetical protein